MNRYPKVLFPEEALITLLLAMVSTDDMLLCDHDVGICSCPQIRAVDEGLLAVGVGYESPYGVDLKIQYQDHSKECPKGRDKRWWQVELALNLRLKEVRERIVELTKLPVKLPPKGKGKK